MKRRLSRVVALAVVVFIVYLINEWRSADETNTSTIARNHLENSPGSIDSALLSHADASKTIVLSLFDTSYADMAYNLYATSFVKFNINNYLFIGADHTACQRLNSFHPGGRHGSVYCVTRFNDVDGLTSSQYGTESFRRKTHLKTRVILDALQLKLNVLIVDLDIVFFNNPLPYFTKCTMCDLQIQDDMKNEGNSGFYFVRPTNAAIHLLNESLIFGERNQTTNQKALMAVLQILKANENNSIYVHTLDSDAFPCGFVFFEKRRIFYLDDVKTLCENCTMMHNNWIVGKEAKIYRFKELGMWQVDSGNTRTAYKSPTGGYYTDPKGRYLVYENTQNFGSDKTLLRETNALKSALYVGHVLNRTVILPKFHCYGCMFGTNKTVSESCSKINRCLYNDHDLCVSMLRERNASVNSAQINKSANVSNEEFDVLANRCTLNSFFNIVSFDDQFSGAYREHAFLRHSKVPDAIKRNKSPVGLIASSVTRGHLANEVSKEVDIFRPANLAIGATRGEILSWFLRYREVPLLRFHSMYGAIADGVFNSSENENDKDYGFFKRLETGLTPGVYRQYQ